MNYSYYKTGEKDGRRFGFAMGVIAGVSISLLIASLFILN